MNLLEHYIKQVHNIKDVTNDYNNHTNDVALEPLLEVDLTYDCYGAIQRRTMKFWKNEWDNNIKRGYFFG